MPISRNFVSRVVAVVALSHAIGAHANRAEEAHARATLVSDTSTVVAGQPFTVAITFAIDPGWHLYWKDSGDSGLPPSVKWKLPEGFTAGELQFPSPKVLKTPAGVNYVYEEKLTLLATLTPPPTLKAGERYEIAAAVKWLECDEDTCLPAKQDGALSVTAGTQATPQHEAEFAAWKAAAKEGESYRPPAR